MKLVRITLSLLIVALFASGTNVFAGKSDKTEIRNVKNFDEIEVSTGIDLYITMGNSESVKVVADDDIIEKVKTEVRGKTLHIYMKNNNWLNIFNWSGNKTRRAYVTLRDLKRINASSGSDVESENTLEGETLDIEVSSGSDVKLDVIYKEISLKSSSGSDARLSGKAKTFRANASSGSDIKARELQSSVCVVNVSSGSDATVSVSDELHANASSGGDVRYYGNPTVVDIDESSGGDVSGR